MLMSCYVSERLNPNKKTLDYKKKNQGINLVCHHLAIRLFLYFTGANTI
jgi:hypothetical protein